LRPGKDHGLLIVLGVEPFRGADAAAAGGVSENVGDDRDPIPPRSAIGRALPESGADDLSLAVDAVAERVRTDDDAPPDCRPRSIRRPRAGTTGVAPDDRGAPTAATEHRRS